MSRAAAKPIAGAILLPSLGIALALGLSRLVDAGEGRELGAYAIGTVPLAAAVGAIAGARARREPTGGAGVAIAGLSIAIGAALAVAYLQAIIRFRYLGSTGIYSGPTLLSTKEVLMVVGILPATATLGAVVARRPPRPGPLVAAGLAGAVTSLLAGPTLVLVSLLGRVG